MTELSEPARPDILCLAGFMRVLTPAFVARFEGIPGDGGQIFQFPRSRIPADSAGPVHPTTGFPTQPRGPHVKKHAKIEHETGDVLTSAPVSASPRPGVSLVPAQLAP